MNFSAMKREYAHRPAPKPPADTLVAEVRKVLERKGLWQESLISDLPKSWEKYGDLVLFNGERSFRSTLWREVDGVWKTVCSVLKVDRVALRYSIQQDEFRSPNVLLLSGDNSWVEYKDNGILYSWDIKRSMFCAGNAPERHRLSKLDCTGEVVLDMFAGIGYFTLPFLVKAKAKAVHACEWNPAAVEALKKNLQKNHVSDKCIVHEGDSTKVSPENIADRVNLGLLPSSEVGWEAACCALKPTTGGILHVHENVVSKIPSSRTGNVCSHPLCFDRYIPCRECHTIVHEMPSTDQNTLLQNNLKERKFSFSICSDALRLTNNSPILWKRVEWLFWSVHVCHKLCDIFGAHRSTPWNLSVVNLHHVKSYAPHIDHLVLDIQCIPVSNPQEKK